MKILSRLSLMLIAIVMSTSLAAQSVDLGRGELPLTVPAGYDGEIAVPLVVLLHGYTSSGASQDSYMGFSDLADRYGYIMVAPDGNREPGGNQARYWNASNACCDFFSTQVDDSTYIRSIIEEIKSNYNIDDKRVYLIGHSNGGFMSYRMAYEHSETIAAIASLAGANHIEQRDAPAMPVHILQIHGTADDTIAYGGGEIQENRYPGAIGTVSRWASYNGCQDRGYAREVRDLDASLPGHETGVMVYNNGCAAGGSAELWTITAGSHVPPLSDSFAEQVIEWLYAHPKP